MTGSEANEVEGLPSMAEEGEPCPYQYRNHEELVPEGVNIVINSSPDLGDQKRNG